MKKSMAYVIAILAMSQGTTAMETVNKFHELENRVRQLVGQDKLEEASSAVSRLFMLDFADEPYKSIVQSLGDFVQKAKDRKRENNYINKFWAVHDEAQELIRQGKLDDAEVRRNELIDINTNLKVYCTSFLPENIYDETIADLRKSISQAKTK